MTHEEIQQWRSAGSPHSAASLEALQQLHDSLDQVVFAIGQVQHTMPPATFNTLATHEDAMVVLHLRSRVSRVMRGESPTPAPSAPPEA